MARRENGPARIRQAKTDSGGRPRLTKPDKKSPIGQLAQIKASSNIVIPEVKKILLEQKAHNAGKMIHRSNVIFPSEMARSEWCARATYYRMSGRPEPASTPSFSLENVFSEGNRIHSKWQGWLAQTGNLWGDWYCNECGTRINNSLKPPDSKGFYVSGMEDSFHDWEYKEVTLKSTSHMISGHADGALVNHNVLIEIKSMGIGTFRFEAPKLFEDHTYDINGKKVTDIEGMWRQTHRPLMSHVKQGNIYLYMAEELGMPFDRIVFLYEFKANQQVKEFVIKKSDDIIKPLLEKCSEIENALTIGVPPPCRNGSDGCSACKAYENAF